MDGKKKTVGDNEGSSSRGNSSLENSPDLSFKMKGDSSFESSTDTRDSHDDFFDICNEEHIYESGSDIQSDSNIVLRASRLFEMGSRNPASTGLTMKEYEEQLKKLTGENFNLKLRAYFLEERLSKIAGISDMEELIKKNIELKVACETRSKELASKQELLFEASKAFSVLQKEHKEEIEKLVKEKDVEKAGLEARILELEAGLKDFQSRLTDGEHSEEKRSSDHEDCEHHIQDLENRLCDEEEKVSDLENDIKDLQMERDSLHLRLERLDQELEVKNGRIQKLVEELEQCGEELASCKLQIRNLEETISCYDNQKNKERLEEKMKVIEMLRTSLSARDNEIAVLRSKMAKERATAQSLQSKHDTASFQNTRLKEELEMLQARLRRSTEHLSPRSRPSTRTSEDETSKYQDILREYEIREEDLTKQIKELQMKLLERDSELQDSEQLYQKHKKLESEHKRACVALKNCIKRAKEDKEEKERLKDMIQEKEDVIKDLSQNLDRFRSGTSTDSKPSRTNDSEDEKDTRKVEKIPEIVNISNDCRNGIAMERQIQCLLNSLKEKELLLNEYERKFSVCICDVEAKMGKISNLENEVSALKTKIKERQNDDLDTSRENLSGELAAKELEIQKLNNELRKRTYNLQELVNKELWDKNRQIEKLEHRLATIIERNELEVMSLNQQISARDHQLKLLQDKVEELGVTMNMPLALVQDGSFKRLILEERREGGDFMSDDVNILKEQLQDSLYKRNLLCRKVEELKEKLRNTPERDSESRTVQVLKNECAKAKEEGEKAEIFKKDILEVCSLLTGRLEELAGFLDSLLTDRELLSEMGVKRRKAIRLAVEKSRELSRNLSLSFTSKSFAEMSNLLQNFSFDGMSDDDSCGDILKEKYKSLLADSNVGLKQTEISQESPISVSRDKVISEQSAMILKLRNQLKLLNQEIKQRDIELSLYQNERRKTPCSSPTVENENKSIGKCKSAVVLNGGGEKDNALENSYSLISIHNDSIFRWLNLSASELNLVTNDNIIPEEGQVVETPESSSRSRRNLETYLCALSPKCKELNLHLQEASESEAWSEPDRSVSLARMGILEESTGNYSSRTAIKAEDSTASSEETINEVNRSQAKRPRSIDSAELRRLQSKLKIAEQTNEKLKSELKILRNVSFDGKEPDETLLDKLKENCRVLEDCQSTCQRLEKELSEAIEKAATATQQYNFAQQNVNILQDQVNGLKDRLSKKCQESDEQRVKLTELEEAIQQQKRESETKLKDVLKQKEIAEQRTSEVERQLTEAEDLRKEVEVRVAEIEKKLMESMKNKSDSFDHVKEAEKRIKDAEVMMEEAVAIKLDAERKSKDIQSFIDLMRKEVEEKLKEAERRIKKSDKEKEEVEKQITDLKKKLYEAEKNKSEVEMRVKEGKERIQWMEEKLKELEVAMDQCNEQAKQRIVDIQKKADAKVYELEKKMEEREWVRRADSERKVVEAEKLSKQIEADFKNQIEDALQQAEENALSKIQMIEVECKNHIVELQQKLEIVEREKYDISKELRRLIDEGRVETSRCELEVARLANEKLCLEEKLKTMEDKEYTMVKHHKEVEHKYMIAIQKLEEQLTDIMKNKSDLAVRLQEIENTNADLVKRLSAIQGKDAILLEHISSSILSPPPSPVLQQGSPLCSLLSEVELCLPEINRSKVCQENSHQSELSDYVTEDMWAVRTMDAFAPVRRNANNSSPDLGIESDQGRFSSLEQQQQCSETISTLSLKLKEEGDIKRLEFENSELRRRLAKTRQALEETLTQLTAANQRKKQVERAICKQLHKTHHILKKARVNFEGQELDLIE